MPRYQKPGRFPERPVIQEGACSSYPPKLEKAVASSRRGSRVDKSAAYHAEGIPYLPAEARFDYLLNRPEAENIGAKVNTAVRDIEKHNAQLAGVLPKTYNLFTSTLLRNCSRKSPRFPPPWTTMSSGASTITSSANSPAPRARPCLIHSPVAIRNFYRSPLGIRHSTCLVPHGATGCIDFVLANPPFNVNAVDKERLKEMVGPGRRSPFALPRADNANYLRIQLFCSALKDGEAGTSGGRVRFVMPNSVSATGSSTLKSGD